MTTTTATKRSNPLKNIAVVVIICLIAAILLLVHAVRQNTTALQANFEAQRVLIEYYGNQPPAQK